MRVALPPAGVAAPLCAPTSPRVCGVRPQKIPNGEERDGATAEMVNQAQRQILEALGIDGNFGLDYMPRVMVDYRRERAWDAGVVDKDSRPPATGGRA